MKNLTSIADHSDWLLSISIPEYRKFQIHRKRVEFGKQILEKWMFVPCDEYGNVLTKSTMSENTCEDDCNHKNCVLEMNECIKYQQAKERCLLEGFSITKNDSRHIRIKKGEVSMIFFIESNSISFYDMFCESHDVFTIEDLVKYNLQLTPTAQKQLES